MRMVAPTILILPAAIHALPVLGVLGAARLSQLYGITVEGQELTLLLQHWAVLFALLAAFFAAAVPRPELHRMASIAGWVSVLSCLLLSRPTAALNAASTTAVRADWVALVLLVIGAAVNLRNAAGRSERPRPHGLS
ncbi:MAG: phosphopantetheine adenylyltransferase [Rubrivivax sp.]|nr:phosphopantetheine adenylyltransferase [Rubrivivax sp.]